MPVEMHGRWRLEVVKAIHNWENRYVITGADQGNGTYAGNVGEVIDVAGLPSWELRGEYEDPDEPGAWKPTEMRVLSSSIHGADLSKVIGAEDPLPHEDYEDLQWEATFTGSMIGVPYRPYAVRPADLFQMPDGVFESALGTYYMGVRVRNRWGRSLSDHHVVDVSDRSRTALSNRGVEVIDAWSDAELRTLGQEQDGTGMVLGPLEPGESRTVFFKVDVSDAPARKHPVEFVCLNTGGTVDPGNEKRSAERSIFVSNSHVDPSTDELVCEVDEGELRMSLDEIALDRERAVRNRERKPVERRRADEEEVRRDLRETVDALLRGEDVDVCEIQRLLSCYCAGGEGDGDDDLPPSDDRFTYGPFYAIPKEYSYDIHPDEPYEGQYGPLPYQDPWWKVALLIVAAVLLVAGALEEASDAAYHDEDIVIGPLDRWQQDDVDAAVCRLTTDRVRDFDGVLDAQSGEPFDDPVTSLDGTVDLEGPVMSKSEVRSLAMLPSGDPERKVFKSGARTGLTHGIVSGFVDEGYDELGTTWSIDQLRIDPDPDFESETSREGDSGSIWVHAESHRPVALHHTGNVESEGGPEFSTASLLEDVTNQLDIEFTL